jgi:hypothetical protein
MSKNLTIKCEEITSIGRGGFRCPDLEVEMDSVDANDIIDQLDTTEVLEYIGCVDLVTFLEGEGYTVTN